MSGARPLVRPLDLTFIEDEGSWDVPTPASEAGDD